jgi:hypothetical protein
MDGEGGDDKEEEDESEEDGDDGSEVEAKGRLDPSVIRDRVVEQGSWVVVDDDPAVG